MIKIIAPIKPVPFQRVIPRVGRPRNPARYTEFKNELGYFALKEMKNHALLQGEIKISVEFYKKRHGVTNKNWGDVDNFLKAVMDSLTGICYEDDGQVVEIHARKNYGEPHIVIELENVK